MAQGRFDAGKPRIDDNFKKDLDNKCATYNVLEEAACKGVAEVYYEAVKEFGGTGIGKMRVKERRDE